MRNAQNGVQIVELIDGARPIGTVSGTASATDRPAIRTRGTSASSSCPRRAARATASRPSILVARLLFADAPVNRVEAMTDIENIAEQRALEKAGFVREGVMRGSQFRAGAYHDLVSYSILRARGRAGLSGSSARASYRTREADSLLVDSPRDLS